MTSVELELLQNKKRDGKSVTHGHTDGQTDDGEVIPKCHLCLQQVTQKMSIEDDFMSDRPLSFKTQISVGEDTSNHQLNFSINTNIRSRFLPGLEQYPLHAMVYLASH